MVAGGEAVWIAEQMQLLRLQQRDLAAALGIDPAGVTRLLKGQRKLKPEELPLLQQFFAQFATPGSMPPPRLVRAMSLREADMAELAVRTGITPTRLLQIKYGQGDPLGEQERVRLAAAFDQTEDYMFSAVPLPADGRTRLLQGWKRGGGERAPLSTAQQPPERGKLPVYRALRPVGPRGWFADDSVIADRRMPPATLADASGGYGIFFDGPSHGMLLPGDVVWVHPNRPVIDGTRAVGRTDREVAFGVLDSRSGRRWLLGSTPGPIELPIDVRLESIIAIESR